MSDKVYVIDFDAGTNADGDLVSELRTMSLDEYCDWQGIRPHQFTDDFVNTLYGATDFFGEHETFASRDPFGVLTSILYFVASECLLVEEAQALILELLKDENNDRRQEGQEPSPVLDLLKDENNDR